MIHPRGFTFIEVMLGLVLSAVITAGLMNVVIHNKFNAQYQDAESQLENKLHYAQFFLSQQIRAAGFVGCNNLANLNINSAIPIGLKTIAGYTKENNDVIHISSADSNLLYLKVAMKSPHDILVVPNSFSKKRILVISDCSHADIFPAAQVTPNTIPHPTFSKNYPSLAQISIWHDAEYYLSQTKHTDQNGRFVYALYYKDFPYDSQELVDDITGMQISYADKISSSTFVKANQVTDWDRVKIVKITLTASATVNQTLLEKSITFFVTLRNRIE